MTKSQNTTSEQQKDLCITSEQLTEQMKKGELKLGEHYYYTTIFSPTVHIQNFTRDVVSFQDFKETVAEVLAPVPSYGEWKSKLEENAQLKEEISRESYKVSEAYCFVEELKELLKECRDIMNKAGFLFAKVDDVEKAKDLIKKIKEVLK